MNRNTGGAALIAVLAGLAPPASGADALSSSYWEAAYLNGRLEIDGLGAVTPEGFRTAASVGLASFLNFAGEYDQRRENGARLGFGSAGFAFHTRHPAYRFHGALSYERIVPDDGDYDEGYGVEVGARYALPGGELHASYRYLDFGETDTGADLTGARYGLGFGVQLSNWWSLVADYRIREHERKGAGSSSETQFDEWTVGWRRYFATAPDRRVRKGGVFGGEPAGGP